VQKCLVQVRGPTASRIAMHLKPKPATLRSTESESSKVEILPPEISNPDCNTPGAINFIVSQDCVLPGLDRSVKICTPTAGQPPKVRCKSKQPLPMPAGSSQCRSTWMVLSHWSPVYLEETSLAVSPGTHRITVKAWDAAGQFSQGLQVNVP
jgi:hypothetical protein